MCSSDLVPGDLPPHPDSDTVPFLIVEHVGHAVHAVAFPFASTLEA